MHAIRSAALPHHQRRGVPRRHISRAQPNVEHIGELEWLLPERLWIRQIVVDGRGVVDQQIQPATFVRDSFEQGGNRGVVAVIDIDGNSAVAGVGHRSAGQIHPPTVGQRAPRRCRVRRRDSPPSRPPPAAHCASRVRRYVVTGTVSSTTGRSPWRTASMIESLSAEQARNSPRAEYGGQVLGVAALEALRRRLGVPLHAGLIPAALARQHARSAAPAGHRHHR